MVATFWFMLLVAWFWLLISIITDVFRDEEMSGWGKGAWCLFLIVLPWVGVLTYLIARGRSMNERSMKAARKNEQAFREYVQQAATPTQQPSLADELSKLADLRARGEITPQDYDMAKAKLLAHEAATPPAEAPTPHTV
jgi:hypothetical protein